MIDALAPALLRYDLTTSVFPLQASPAHGELVPIVMTIVSSNPSSSPIELQGMIVTLPVGEAGADLTNDATGIGAIPPPHWMLSQTNYGTGSVSFIFQPDGGSYTIGADSLDFVFAGVGVNRQPGTVKITVTEGSGGCIPPACPVALLYVTKFPSGWGDVTYRSNPSPPIIEAGDGLTLLWSGPAGATYVIGYYTPQTGPVRVPPLGARPLPNAGIYPGQTDPPLHLTQDTTFTLTVTETIDQQTFVAEKQITATIVTPTPTIDLFRATAQPAASGYDLTFFWQTRGAQMCTISSQAEQLTGSSPSDGWPTTSPELDAAYTLNAMNAGGVSTAVARQSAYVIAATLALSGDKVANGIAATLDGAHIYAMGFAWIDVYTPASNPISLVVGGRIDLNDPPGMWVLNAIAISPDGARLYAVRYDTGAGRAVLQAVDVASHLAIGPAYPVSPNARGVAASPDGKRVYVANAQDESIAVFTTNANPADPLSTFGAPFVLPSFAPLAIAVSSDGTRVYSASGARLVALQPTDDPQRPLVEVASGNAGSDVMLVTGLATSPRNPYLVAAALSTNTILRLFDPVTLRPLENPPKINSAFPSSVAVGGARVYFVTGFIGATGTIFTVLPTAFAVR